MKNRLVILASRKLLPQWHLDIVTKSIVIGTVAAITNVCSSRCDYLISIFVSGYTVGVIYGIANTQVVKIALNLIDAKDRVGSHHINRLLFFFSIFIFFNYLEWLVEDDRSSPLAWRHVIRSSHNLSAEFLPLLKCCPPLALNPCRIPAI